MEAVVLCELEVNSIYLSLYYQVEDAVDSDAEDEVDREEDHTELLLKMRNLKNKLSSKASIFHVRKLSHCCYLV